MPKKGFEFYFMNGLKTRGTAVKFAMICNAFFSSMHK